MWLFGGLNIASFYSLVWLPGLGVISVLGNQDGNLFGHRDTAIQKLNLA